MGGEYCPTAVPPTLSAPAIWLYRSTAPCSDAIINENSRPQTSWAEIDQRLAQVITMLARMLMEPLSHSPPPPHCGGSTTLSACDLPLARASPPDRLAKGLMAPSPATTEAAMPLPSLAHPSTPAWSYPSHPHRTMGGDSRRVDGTLPCYHRGGIAIAKLGPSFLANLVFSHPPSTNDGGERRLGGMPCFGTQSPAFGIQHVKTPRIC